MLPIRILVAFIAGALLYQTAVVFAGGVLAAIAIPKAYFAWFGPRYIELALAIVQIVGFALPVALLVAGGTLSIRHVLGGNPRTVLSAVLAGMILCFVYWIAVGVYPPPTDLPAAPLASSVLLEQMLRSPWWAVFGFLAPWLGFALAAWLFQRRRSA
jgi:hypothetical protein